MNEDMSTTVAPSLVSEIQSSRQQFLALVADLRPDLHRYCARMTGSVSDGEDIVQETLARAYYALPELHSLPPLRSWLFRIAHNAALDHLRRYDRRMGRPLDEVAEPPDDTLGADDELSAREAVQAALTRFLQLPASQRSCVVLKDVLGHSVDEIAALVGLSVPAVKAALHRGRQTLRTTGEAATQATASAPSTTSPEIVRYVALFNAHDWDGVRAGDRSFDLGYLAFTMLWKTSNTALHERIWDAFLCSGGHDSRVVYMHHVVLRQVDWVIRHPAMRPGPPRTIELAAWALAVTEEGAFRPLE